ncbi:MAG: hypothetical protein K6V36_11265 [Anaerolineae bacterium]|nr:hypothetical protein [Anaerolineae bacterium]
MKRSRAELRAEILANFEVQLDSFLDWAEANHAPTLVEIEQAVLRCRREIGRAMAAAVVNAQDTVQLAPGPKCPDCGQEMHIKGRKRKYVETHVGGIETKRCYYYCPRCRRGFFPPG